MNDDERIRELEDELEQCSSELALALERHIVEWVRASNAPPEPDSLVWVLTDSGIKLSRYIGESPIGDNVQGFSIGKWPFKHVYGWAYPSLPKPPDWTEDVFINE